MSEDKKLYEELQVEELAQEELQEALQKDVQTEDWEDVKEDVQDEKVNWKKELISWVLTIAITFACVMILRTYVIVNADVVSGSMENTIMTDDQVFGSRLSYVFGEPKRGDIIFFYPPFDIADETREFFGYKYKARAQYVKRVIGLPGEKVTIKEGKIYINDSETPLDEPYLKEAWTRKTGPYEFEVPEGHYLVLGDNRNNSADARDWLTSPNYGGNVYVPKENIVGQAFVVYWPLNHIEILE